MDDENDEDFLPPANTNTFGIPNEPALLGEYELYRPSMGTRRLYSERNREIYSEAFIENPRLGTLVDLCVRALAKLGTRYIAQPVAQVQRLLRIHYDSLDVDLPLKDCYFVEDVRFWRRVVLAKSSDISLPIKKVDEYDWKGTGISLKYVELVEACPAAYWPEKEMAQLGYMVREFVRSMEIKHLQSLTDSAFKEFVESDSELDITSDEELPEEVSSDEDDTLEAEEEGEEEEEAPLPKKNKGSATRGLDLKIQVVEVSHDNLSESLKKISSLGTPSVAEYRDEATEKRREARHARNAARQQLRELNEEKRIEREKRRNKRALLRKPPPPPPKAKKSKKKKPVTGVFDLEVDPEPDDGQDKIADNRNKDKLIRRLKRYDYPSKHCHHIDLGFVRYFNQLTSLTIEFQGPKMGRNYHKRHMNFSYDDMVRLSKGLHTLHKLKIFRLRNSHMDHVKLLILARTLKQLDSLEVADFGHDHLDDDCDVALGILLDRTVMLKSLELEYNRLQTRAIESIGDALLCHSATDPENGFLQYLGLAHNPINELGLNRIISNIVDSHHVEELNISGILTDSRSLSNDISYLLRNHKPLRSLVMAAVKLNPVIGKRIICGLETNHKIMHFDCRGCDLDTDEEYEADLIVRRNSYEAQHSYLGDETQTEATLLAHFAAQRHPIIAKIEADNARREECIRNRPVSSTSELAELEEQKEELEEEFDIWQMFGVQQSTAKQEYAQSVSISSSQGIFNYDPNSFNLEQLREFLDVPGPKNRYYYLQRQKET